MGEENKRRDEAADKYANIDVCHELAEEIFDGKFNRNKLGASIYAWSVEDFKAGWDARDAEVKELTNAMIEARNLLNDDYFENWEEAVRVLNSARKEHEESK